MNISLLEILSLKKNKKKPLNSDEKRLFITRTYPLQRWPSYRDKQTMIPWCLNMFEERTGHFITMLRLTNGRTDTEYHSITSIINIIVKLAKFSVLTGTCSLKDIIQKKNSDQQTDKQRDRRKDTNWMKFPGLIWSPL